MSNVNVIKRLKLKYFSGATAAILGGIAIYIFFRDINNMLLFCYIPKWSFLNTLNHPLKIGPFFSNILIFNLPYGMWCLSGLLFIRAIWLTNTKVGKYYRIVFIFLIIFYIFLKLPGIIPGTFDVLDLFFMAFFAFLESIIFNRFIRRKIP